MTTGFDLEQRAAGVLLHPTSLPGPHGSGDLGPEAHRFAEFLASAGQRWWQMLPVGPTGYGNSPYSAQSTFAGNPLLASPELLADEGLLDPPPAARTPRWPENRVDYGVVGPHREGLRRAAFSRFQSFAGGAHLRAEYERFQHESRDWLDDFALYAAIKHAHHDIAWTDWPDDIRARRPDAIERVSRELKDEIAFRRFEQFAFARQWSQLRARCHALGVGLIGDVPIFVAHDSCDVWAHPDIFQVDERGQPTVVAGVPPDYFSKTGQRWGNPLYRWDVLSQRNYDWWLARIGITLARFDAVRLDHFIGFERYWEVPAAAATAETGRWLPGPRDALFEAIRRAHGSLPLIAEDLGMVTDEVRALRDRLGLPGIKILQFAFGGTSGNEEFKPHTYPRRCVAYTGSHDNDTTVGWFTEEGGHGAMRSQAQAATDRKNALDYTGGSANEIHWWLLRSLYASVANLVIVPMQDLLGLGSEARMNRPGKAEGNWEWRMKPGAASPRLAGRLARLAEVYGRASIAVRQTRGKERALE